MELQSKISQLQSEGKTKEQIYVDLINQNHSINDINQAFLMISGSQLNQVNESGSSEKSKVSSSQAVLVIAAILVGIGIFSLVASNWQDMTKASKVILIIAGMMGSYFASYTAAKNDYAVTGLSFLLLANLIYGAGIFLIGQIFNVRGSWPDGVLLWMLGVIAVSVATDIKLLFSLSALLGFVSLVGYPIYNSFNGLSSRTFLFTSSFLLFVASAATFYVGYHFYNKNSLDKN